MRAYVINLARRPDRLAYQKKQAEDLGLDLVRIEAVDGKNWDGWGFKKQGRSLEAKWRGAAGCYFSHREALAYAIYLGVFPCMILEDDCVLSEVPMAEPGMVYLGGFESAKGIYGLHAVMYNTKEDADGFLDFLMTHKNTADSVANIYRKANLDKVKKYSKGFIARQLRDHSDIEGCVMERSADGKIKR
jgi:hypothetical protein